MNHAQLAQTLKAKSELAAKAVDMSWIGHCPRSSRVFHGLPFYVSFLHAIHAL